MSRHTVAVCLMLVLLLGLLGCGMNGDSSIPTAEQSIGHQSSHGIAAHRPKSFSEAVEQLTTRYQALVATPPDNTDVDIADALQQLKDIVHWLPELAGDTDLRRVEWEQVQQLTLNLQQFIEPWQTAKDATDPSGKQHFNNCIAELHSLAEKTVVSSTQH